MKHQVWAHVHEMWIQATVSASRETQGPSLSLTRLPCRSIARPCPGHPYPCLEKEQHAQYHCPPPCKCVDHK